MPLTRKLASKSLIKQPTEQDIFAGSVVNMTTNSFVGDGLTAVFTLSSTPFSIVNTQVFISGVYQEKSTYTISGTTLTFSTAPPLNATIEVMVGTNYSVGIPADGVVSLAKLTAAVAQALNPTGTILAYGGSTAPSGYLLCNGTSYSTATYPALFAAIGYAYGGAGANFNVPDTRNVFLRGANAATRSIGGITYPAVVRGTTYGDKMQGHWHRGVKLTGGGTSAYRAAGETPINLNVEEANFPNLVKEALTDGVNGTPRTGSETAPVHLGVNYIIKT